MVEGLAPPTRSCELLWCFYQLFGLSFWWHPFTAEDPFVYKWCNAIFLKICWRNNLTSWMACGWVNFQQTVIFGWIILLRPVSDMVTFKTLCKQQLTCGVNIPFDTSDNVRGKGMRVYVAKVEKNWKWSDRGAISFKIWSSHGVCSSCRLSRVMVWLQSDLVWWNQHSHRVEGNWVISAPAAPLSLHRHACLPISPKQIKIKWDPMPKRGRQEISFLSK